ncbi:MAG: hypothetical protein K8F25_12775 [Fimbriimonadaceae bacterium]|nr:hypothetical protein [Alphaproteobacteria bacterium]
MSSNHSLEQAQYKSDKSFRNSLLTALLLHSLVILVPPFLSDDALAYSAIGSAIGLYGQPMYAPIGSGLPESDAYLQLLAQYPEWLTRGSTYGPAFNAFAALVIGVAGQNVSLALHLFQLISAAALFATALLASEAAMAWAASISTDSDPQRVRLHVLRLILFCPLALIEATNNAHNDVFLALAVAVFTWLVVKRSIASAILVLITGVAIKFSGILPVAFIIAQKIASRMTSLRTLISTGLLFATSLGIMLWIVWPVIEQSASTIIRLIGSPNQLFPFCTRSLECIPRVIFHLVLDAPITSWLIGLVFRAGGIMLLVILAIRARTTGQILTFLAAFILLYYLFFHAYMQAWYLLSLLPILYFLDDRLKPVALTFVISSLAQYSLDFSLACLKVSPWAEIRETFGLLFVLSPPIFVLVSGMFKRHQDHTGGKSG